MTTPTDLVGVEYVAEVLDVDRATITRRLSTDPEHFDPEPVGKMPGSNGAYVWRRAEVDAWAAFLADEEAHERSLARAIENHDLALGLGGPLGLGGLA